MADVLKQLVTTTANKRPGAGLTVTVYTVPSGTVGAVVSRILIANVSTNMDYARIALVKSGELVGTVNWIAYDIPIQGSDTLSFPVGCSMGVGDFISLYSLSGGLVFTPCGVEVV